MPARVYICGATGLVGTAEVNGWYEQADPEVYENVDVSDSWLFLDLGRGHDQDGRRWRRVGDTGEKDARSSREKGFAY